MRSKIIVAVGACALLTACQSSRPPLPSASPAPAPVDPVAERVAFEECGYSVEIPWDVERLSYVSERGTNMIEYRADRLETADTLPEKAYFAVQCYLTEDVGESNVRETARGLADASGARDYSVVPLVGPQNQSVYTSIGLAGFRVMQWISPDDRIAVIYASADYADEMFGSIEPN